MIGHRFTWPVPLVKDRPFRVVPPAAEQVLLRNAAWPLHGPCLEGEPLNQSSISSKLGVSRDSLLLKNSQRHQNKLHPQSKSSPLHRKPPQYNNHHRKSIISPNHRNLYISIENSPKLYLIIEIYTFAESPILPKRSRFPVQGRRL